MISLEKKTCDDYIGFEQAMKNQRQKSQETSRFTMDSAEDLQVEGETEFTGHDRLSDQAIVTALLQSNQAVQSIAKRARRQSLF